MFESFEPGKTEKAKCPKKRREEEKKNSTLPKTMPQAAGKKRMVPLKFECPLFSVATTPLAQSLLVVMLGEGGLALATTAGAVPSAQPTARIAKTARKVEQIRLSN